MSTRYRAGLQPYSTLPRRATVVTLTRTRALRDSAAPPRLLHPIPDARAVIGGIGRSKFYELVAAGEIEVVHVGRRTLVPDEALTAYVARLRAASGTGDRPAA